MSAEVAQNDTVESVEQTNFEYGDELRVSYDKHRSRGGYTFTGEVVAVRQVAEGYVEVDVKDRDRSRSYTLEISESEISGFSITVSTNYPREKDNQSLGGDATVQKI